MAVGLYGCQVPTHTVQPAPIALALPGGALGGFATVDQNGAPFSVLLDTGTAITAYDSLPGTPHDARAHLGTFQLYDATTTERLELFHIALYDTPLRSIGLNAAGAPIGGILGGDNLSLFAASFNYLGGPTMTLTEIINTCSCQLAADCQAVFRFALQGGQQTIALGSNLYTYPATRVVLDACLEPIADPLQQNQPCDSTVPGMPPTPPYQSSGVDVKLLVATGFPGFAIGAKAYDRLRGLGAAAAALAASSDRLHLPDPVDDGPSGEGLAVAQVTLGGGSATREGQRFGLSALSLVSHELYFGPCAELARSRRQRRTPPLGPILRPDESACLQRPNSSVLPEVQGCVAQQSNLAVCDDANSINAIAAVIELGKPLPALVVDDAATLLAGPNADVRPQNPTIEGILGTELLAQLSTTLDYPNGRAIVHCVAAQCLTYPRLVQLNECGTRCEDAASIMPIQCDNGPLGSCVAPQVLPTTSTRQGAVCPPAP